MEVNAFNAELLAGLDGELDYEQGQRKRYRITGCFWLGALRLNVDLYTDGKLTALYVADSAERYLPEWDGGLRIIDQETGREVRR